MPGKILSKNSFYQWNELRIYHVMLHGRSKKFQTYHPLFVVAANDVGVTGLQIHPEI